MTQSLPPKSIILYADDDPDDILLVKNAFEAYQHSVELVTFPNGAQLLKYLTVLPLSHKTPSLVILDINMPLLSGKEVLQQLRSIPAYKNTPVALFSTSTLPSERSFAEAWNALFVTKPLELHQMNKIIEQFIDHCPDEEKTLIRRRFF